MPFLSNMCWRGAALLLALAGSAFADPLPPTVWPERPPIAPTDGRIIGWANGVAEVHRGPQAKYDPAGYGDADFGTPDEALREANVSLSGEDPNTYTVISLGDGGWITLTFPVPIRDGSGPDIAVFENSFSDTFLELAFVEVSSDGTNFVRFPAVSLTPTAGLHDNLNRDDFSTLDPNNLYNLAGKYRGGLGTPFDLAELAGQPNLNINNIVAVRVRDVVGSVDGYATFDSLGKKIKDPFPTVFPECGFDLDAVAILYVPEPSASALLCGLAAMLGFRRRYILIGARRDKGSTGVPPRWRKGIVVEGGWASPVRLGVPPSRLRGASHSSNGEDLRRVEPPGATPAGTGGTPVLPRGHSAFTLLELLIVVALIAILALLVSGGMRVARDRVETAECASNLRQLAGANAAYAAEHDGTFVFAQEPQNSVRWHGVRGGASGKFDGAKGPLSPYLGREGRIKLCPTLRRVLGGAESFEEGAGGYGYNAAYIGGTVASTWVPERMANLPRAGQTVMFTDTAFARASGLQEYAYCEPFFSEKPKGRFRNPLNASVHFRHGGFANVAWCDGHVTAEAPSKIDGTNLYGGDAAKWKIGWFGPSDQNGHWRPTAD